MRKILFIRGAGATVEISYKDGTLEKFDLTNMKHYQQQSFKRLYFSRTYYAGRLNDYNISVVDIDTKGKNVETITLSDANKGANLKVFAITAELPKSIDQKIVYDETVNIKKPG